MTEAAKRDTSFDESLENHGIAEDDPLFELSRIMGLDGEAPVEPGAEIDAQIDLEDALMAEMAVERELLIEEPIVEVDAPAIETPVAEVSRFQGEIQPETLAAPQEIQPEDSIAPELENFAEVSAVETAQPFKAVGDDLTSTEYLDAAFEAAIADDFAAVEEAFEVPLAEVEPIAPAEVIEPTEPMAELEDDFTSFFDDEPPHLDAEEEALAVEAEFEPVAQAAPVEETQLEPTLPSAEQTEVVTAQVDAEIAALDEQIEDIFGAEVAEAAKKADMSAPALETTDMSSFEPVETPELDIPDLPEMEDEFAAAFDDQLTEEISAELSDETSGIAATTALGASVAAGATVLSRKAGESAIDADDKAFDEVRFEAELARDMEFASHDFEVETENNVETNFDQEFESQEFAAAAATNKPAKRGLVMAAVFGCVAIAGAIGYFAYNSGAAEGEPVLVEADTSPVKVEPADPGGKEVPNQDRAVFAETQNEPAQEALNTAAEEPVDVAALPSTVTETTEPEAAAQKQEERLAPTETENTAATAGGEVSVAPRRVRTLVVTPEGNLVERPVVPTPEPIAPATEVAAAPEPAPTSAPEPVVVPEPAAPAPAPVATPAPAPQATQPAQPTVPTRRVQTTTVTPGTITDRPADQPVNIVNPQPAQNTQVAAAPAPAPVAPASAPAASTPFAVQLASLPSQASAQDTANNLSRRFSSVLGGRGLSIRQAEIEGRGTFYRVRVGANSRADANTLCSQIKSAGGDCFVTR